MLREQHRGPKAGAEWVIVTRPELGRQCPHGADEDHPLRRPGTVAKIAPQPTGNPANGARVMLPVARRLSERSCRNRPNWKNAQLRVSQFLCCLSERLLERLQGFVAPLGLEAPRGNLLPDAPPTEACQHVDEARASFRAVPGTTRRRVEPMAFGSDRRPGWPRRGVFQLSSQAVLLFESRRDA